MKQVRKMPSTKQIRRHWASFLVREKGFDSEQEAMEEGICFACGQDGNERCHIKAKQEGGTDHESNLHILCEICHKDSEYLSGDAYFYWLRHRTPVDAFISFAVKRGFNPWAELAKAPPKQGNPDTEAEREQSNYTFG